VNGTRGRWAVPAELPSKDWGPIRETYWASPGGGKPAEFILGGIEPFGRFFAASRAMQAFAPTSVAPVLAAAPTPPAAGAP
jgi:hypothetical protein